MMSEIVMMNYGAIGIASILCVIFGAIWYSPKVFGTAWAHEQPHRKMPEDYQKGAKKMMVASIADSVFFSMMALLLYSAYGFGGVGILAVSVTIGVYTNNCAKGGSDKMFTIDAGFLLCQLAIITCVLAVMVGA